MGTREEVARLTAQGYSQREICEALGIHRKTVHNHQQKLRYLEANPGAADALTATGLNVDNVRLGWRKVKDPNTGSFNTVMWKAPDPLESDVIETIRERIEGLEPAPAIQAPKHCESDLLTLYPIADAHIGMMAWGKETGEAYDTKAACDRLTQWVGRCVDKAPASETAVILDVGDLMHADDETNQTPRSKHVLDVDTRHYRTLDSTLAAMSAAIEYAAQKHKRVVTRILPGNHNPHSYMGLMLALRERYRNSPQIKVQDVPGEFFMHCFGSVMLAAHHGHKAKADRLAHFLADQYAEQWGRTRHRYLWTGHLHHHKAQDIGGLQWEQLRALTARDAYAVSHAYSARAQLQAVTYHRQDGEVERVKVGCR